MKAPQATEQRRIEFGRRGLGAVDPGKHLLVGNIEPGLDFGEFGVGQARQFGVGKATQHEIHLADAAMPQPEFQPPPPRIEAFA